MVKQTFQLLKHNGKSVNGRRYEPQQLFIN